MRIRTQLYDTALGRGSHLSLLALQLELHLELVQLRGRSSASGTSHTTRGGGFATPHQQRSKKNAGFYSRNSITRFSNSGVLFPSNIFLRSLTHNLNYFCKKLISQNIRLSKHRKHRWIQGNDSVVSFTLLNHGSAVSLTSLSKSSVVSLTSPCQWNLNVVARSGSITDNAESWLGGVIDTARSLLTPMSWLFEFQNALIFWSIIKPNPNMGEPDTAKAQV